MWGVMVVSRSGTPLEAQEVGLRSNSTTVKVTVVIPNGGHTGHRESRLTTSWQYKILSNSSYSKSVVIITLQECIDQVQINSGLCSTHTGDHLIPIPVLVCWWSMTPWRPQEDDRWTWRRSKGIRWGKIQSLQLVKIQKCNLKHRFYLTQG